MMSHPFIALWGGMGGLPGVFLVFGRTLTLVAITGFSATFSVRRTAYCYRYVLVHSSRSGSDYSDLRATQSDSPRRGEQTYSNFSPLSPSERLPKIVTTVSDNLCSVSSERITM